MFLKYLSNSFANVLVNTATERFSAYLQDGRAHVRAWQRAREEGATRQVVRGCYAQHAAPKKPVKTRVKQNVKALYSRSWLPQGVAS